MADLISPLDIGRNLVRLVPGEESNQGVNGTSSNQCKLILPPFRRLPHKAVARSMSPALNMTS